MLHWIPGLEAARLAGRGAVQSRAGHAVSPATREEPLQPLWLVPSTQPPGRDPKQFVDPQNDVAAADILLAAREGYHSIEHVKRYTAVGFGTDQGKLGNINGMAILAKALGQTIGETGTTTFRPNYTPVTFGAIAGPDLGEIFEPVRKIAMHAVEERRRHREVSVRRVAVGHRADVAVHAEDLLHHDDGAARGALRLGDIRFEGMAVRRLQFDFLSHLMLLVHAKFTY